MSIYDASKFPEEKFRCESPPFDERKLLERTRKIQRKITLLEDRQRIVASMTQIKSLAENRELRQIDAKEEGNYQTHVTSIAFTDGWSAGFRRVTRQLQEKLEAIDQELAGIET